MAAQLHVARRVPRRAARPVGAAAACAAAVRNMARLTTGRNALIAGGRRKKAAAAAAPIVELLSKACVAQHKHLGFSSHDTNDQALAGWQRWLAGSDGYEGAKAPKAEATQLLRATLELSALATGALANLALHKVV